MQLISQISNPLTPRNYQNLFSNSSFTGTINRQLFSKRIISGLWILETKIVLDNDFLVNPSKTFRNWSEKREEPMPTDAYWLYITVIGFYIQALVCCILVGKISSKRL
jgi:hypothetical protein